MQNRSLAIVFGRSFTLQCACVLYRENFRTISHILVTAANKFTFEPFSPTILLPHDRRKQKKNQQPAICLFLQSLIIAGKQRTHTHTQFPFVLYVRIFVCEWFHSTYPPNSCYLLSSIFVPKRIYDLITTTGRENFQCPFSAKKTKKKEDRIKKKENLCLKKKQNHRHRYFFHIILIQLFCEHHIPLVLYPHLTLLAVYRIIHQSYKLIIFKHLSIFTNNLLLCNPYRALMPLFRRTQLPLLDQSVFLFAIMATFLCP